MWYTITRLGEYEWRREMELIYSAKKFEQINDYLFIESYKSIK